MMLREARSIVSAARDEGVTLRLIGGLAVRTVSRDAGSPQRPARDLDFVGLRCQARALITLFARRGYAENLHVRLGSGGHVMQFFRPCIHAVDGRRAHMDDRVDVYLDTVRLEHSITLRERLVLDDLTVPATDVLLAKLLHTRPNADDLRDTIALLTDLDAGNDDAPGLVNVPYIARLCARDWGLHHDVLANLERSRESAANLNNTEREHVVRTAQALEVAIAAAPKSWRWRLRALAGERLAWSEPLEERDGRHLAVREYRS